MVSLSFTLTFLCIPFNLFKLLTLLWGYVDIDVEPYTQVFCIVDVHMGPVFEDSHSSDTSSSESTSTAVQETDNSGRIIPELEELQSADEFHPGSSTENILLPDFDALESDDDVKTVNYTQTHWIIPLRFIYTVFPWHAIMLMDAHTLCLRFVLTYGCGFASM